MRREEICIGFLSRWNATCGVSLHAELIGKEFIKNGLSIRVFAPYLNSANRWWHHIPIRADEPFVIRCFKETTPEGEPGSIDIDKILNEKINGLIVESWASLPKKDVELLVWKLRKKGIPVVAVIHEGFGKDLGYENLDMFKKIIIFHEGYKEILAGRVKEEKIEVVPYPCIPPVQRKRRFAQDGKIMFFSFGRQPIEEYEDYIEVLKELSLEYPVYYRIIRSSDLLPYKYDWLEQTKKTLLLDEIYENLEKIDIHLIPKGNTTGKVVSSTLCQTLGSLAIHVAPDSAYFEDIKKSCNTLPLLLYGNKKELKDGIVRIIKEPTFRKRITKYAKRYAEENSAYKIAMRILALIDPVFMEDIKKVVNF